MKLKSLFVFFAFISVSALFFFYKKSDVVLDQSFLAVGTSADYPPYCFIDVATQNIVGFDIDVVSEVAKRIHTHVHIKNMPFESLLFELLAQGIDVIAAGMSPTEQREKMVAFSDVYIQADCFVIVTRKSTVDITDLDTLAHKKVAVNTGYFAETFLANNYKDIDLIRLPSPADSLIALQSGAVEAYVCAKAVVDNILTTSFAHEFKTIVIGGLGEGCALAVNKKSVQLLEQINYAIASMKNDGTITKLKAKWNIS